QKKQLNLKISKNNKLHRKMYYFYFYNKFYTIISNYHILLSDKIDRNLIFINRQRFLKKLYLYHLRIKAII
ncbi:MAG: hypothetical protein ACRC41_14735, partial [Sarcina sp.]